MIQITFPDQRVKSYPDDTTPMSVAKDLSNSLAAKVLISEVNGQLHDLLRPISGDAEIKFYTFDDTLGRQTYWHSSAHLLAEAIEALYPGVKFGIGPAIERGFYYDIDFQDRKISLEDLDKIEKKMTELASQNNAYERREISKADAIKYFTEKNDPYKLELIESLEDGSITFYQQGNFVDLCRGPHIPTTNLIKKIKLTSVAGAYWRGDEKRPMLTRIYGITFPKQDQLDEYLRLLEEAKARDHRKLGKELELFTFSEKVGMGLPLWLPKGAMLRESLSQFLNQKQVESGYLPVVTPHIAHKDLYVTSGHYEKYGKDSFQPIKTPHEGEEYFLKPMNCPHHCEIFKSSPRSYRDLPLRFAEFGTVYRYEQHGELHGLLRVRGFTQDDAHLFCKPDQIKEEFKKVIDIVLEVFDAVGFSNYTAQISLRDPENREKYIGSDENWKIAEEAIILSCAEKGLETSVALGEAAFYGPKLDFMVSDALGRKWQLGTIQVDYNLPERFDLVYTGEDNQKHRPVMIHRAPFGSLERFIAVMLELLGGDFPTWLSPTQVAILPISDKFLPYATELNKTYMFQGIKSMVDERNEKIGKKIRDAEMSKVPYLLIIGQKEVDEALVSVRVRHLGDQGSISSTEFAEKILEEIKSRRKTKTQFN